MAKSKKALKFEVPDKSVKPGSREGLDPYLPDDKVLQLRHRIKIASTWLPSDLTPKKLAQWIAKEMAKATADGWTNLVVSHVERERDEFGHTEDYLGLYGDRHETPEEYNQRQQQIVDNWQRELEKFLQDACVWVNGVGIERLKIILEKKDRPISPPYWVWPRLPQWALDMIPEEHRSPQAAKVLAEAAAGKVII